MAHATDIREENERRAIEDLVDSIKDKPLEDISKYLVQKMDLWRSIVPIEKYLNIGVVGCPGVGKSTFINTVRRLKPMDHDAAKTGVVQTTMKPTPYEHPENSRIKLWDLPGIDTPNFSKQKYLEALQPLNLDIFIIVCCSRFTECDLWFASEMLKAKKLFYFVRTKTDIDVRNYRHDYPHTQNSEVIAKVRRDCTENLLAANFQNLFVFLVCKNPLAYDFFALEEKIIADLPEGTRQEMLLTLRSVSTGIINKKAVLLQKRSLCAAAAASAVVQVLDTPLPITVDARIICGEIMFYKKVFGLDDEGLKQLSKSSSVPEQVLVDEIKENFWTNLSMNTLQKEMRSWVVKCSADDGMKHAKHFAENNPKTMVTHTEDFIVAKLPAFTAIKSFLKFLIGSMEKAMQAVLDTAKSQVELRSLM